MLNRRFTLSVAGLAVLATLAAPGALSPAQADGIRTFNCVGSRGSVSCVGSWRRGITNPHITQIPEPRSDLEIAEFQKRDKLWENHCKPTVRHDEFGVPRYVYAVPGCEFGRSQ